MMITENIIKKQSPWLILGTFPEDSEPFSADEHHLIGVRYHTHIYVLVGFNQGQWGG